MNTKNDFGIGYESKNKIGFALEVEFLINKINIINKGINDIEDWEASGGLTVSSVESLQEMKKELKIKIHRLIDNLW